MSYAGYFKNAYSSSLLSYHTPVDSVSGFGLSLCYLYIPIEITTGLDVDDAGYPIADPSMFSYSSSSDIMVNIVYARQIISRPRLNLAAGARISGLRKRLPQERGYGIGLDGGVEAELKPVNIRISLFVEDMSTNVIYWDKYYSDISLPSIRLGIGWQDEIPYIYGSIGLYYSSPDVLGEERVWLKKDAETGESDLVSGNETSDRIKSFLYMGHYGGEYVIRNVVALRGGFSSGRGTFGAGINLFESCLSVDFSYLSSELSGSYLVSASYRW
jgi:hypothetical protein